MTVVRPATKGGVKGHVVHVQAHDKFVRDSYPGTDPRTKVAHQKK